MKRGDGVRVGRSWRGIDRRNGESKGIGTFKGMGVILVLGSVLIFIKEPPLLSAEAFCRPCLLSKAFIFSHGNSLRVKICDNFYNQSLSPAWSSFINC